MNETMQIKVLFFATLKNLAGSAETYIDLPDPARVIDLKALLEQDHPSLAPALASALVAVNKEFAFDEDLIPAGAEVALFPPVSGGTGATFNEESTFPTIFSITEQALDLDELLARITLPTTGAACLFTGMVRAETRRGEPHQTVYLEYEAYKPMAEAKMHQVADEIRSRWPEVEGIVIVQRIGHLEPGTPTVLIACTAAHRETGVFEAARYGINRLKEIVPIWKKEVGPDGELWVEGEYIPGRED
ncbi:MAG TPA: molybdenum cofactor biosynthesis protein MoaE [Anaerolineales bacterium]|nr:molybdenum cofactor biosynthesis protein MoaE [Anaerolineales bacterium]